MAFACPFCNRVLSNRFAYSQHVKRCSENYASSSSEEIFIQNESNIIMSEQEDNSKDNRNNEIIYILDDESRSSPRSNRINDIIQSFNIRGHTSIQYEEPASREPEFEIEESKFESDETESESDETEFESDKTEFESDKTDNESDESEESESAEKETETIPKFPNNTYSDLMTLIIQHNLNNKAGNAIIRFFNKHSNLPTSPLSKNIEQGRKLMDRMKLINLLNKEKSNNNRNYNEQYTANWWAKTEKTIPLGSHLLSIILYSDASTTDTLGKNTLHPIFITLGNIITWRRNKPDVKQLLAYLPIIKAKDDTQKKSEEHKNIDINIYAATVPDKMHHLDLGLFHYQLSFTKTLILEQCGKSFIDKMNNRIKLIPHYQDLKSFSNGFLHLTLLTALEYRSLMKIMIFIVDNLYQDSKRPNFIKNNKITEIYLKWNKMYLLSRKENYEESDITCLQVFHICSSIREFGAINGYTTETYESLHKDYIRRKAIIIESSSKEIPKTPIALKYSKKLYEFCIQNAEIYIQTRMNDLDLEKEMKLGFEKFLKCLDYTCRQNY
ncbi:hypothetical protein Glove_140g177 [Diversispora epigaea]|uniref:C2H2-type domain-containing protein n=1 Tax=Diversispora epigaea TaxID=1348612 RepID=A0A397J4C4_9GLOM|nr:hypothetical protein Glove_140g177 [Diversispora epigaea]